MTATIRISIALALAAASTGAAAGSTIPSPGSDAVDVVGWPLPDLQAPAPRLDSGDDPIYGRQACPPLTRLNLAQKKSEELLLKKAVVEFNDAQRGSAWRLELRPGLFWWSGAGVTAEDTATYVRTVLPELVKTRGGGLWPAPDFTVKADGPVSVVVTWKKAPPFGPFILDGAPFYRPAAAKDSVPAYECAGLYRPEKRDGGVALVPTPGYKQRRPEIRLLEKKPADKAAAPRRLELRYARSLPGTPAARPPDKGSGCSRTLELPYATMIVWNPTRGPTADKDFRRLLTQLVPRGTLVSAGAAALADVASAPVPRQHPGYDAKVQTRPFDIKAAALALNRLGYRRKSPDAPRQDEKGKPLKLTLLTSAGSPGLPEKVIMDAFSAVGINVQFKTQMAEGEQPDGVLATFSLDWPRVSFLANFHSGAKTAAPFWPLGDKELDKELEDYAATLTTEHPDFTKLAAVHRRLAELEPATVLLEHRACLEDRALPRLAKGNLNQRDPDWFRQLLF